MNVSESEDPDVVSDHSINVTIHPGAKGIDDLEFSAFENPYPSIQVGNQEEIQVNNSDSDLEIRSDKSIN
jgi:hypothetical protein